MSDTRKVAQLMRLQLVALGCAVDDVEAGRYSTEERHHLAVGLDTLATALRAEDGPRVVEAERAETTTEGPIGFLEWGSIM